MAQLTFASVYPHDVAKVQRKGRTVDELAKGKSLAKILR
jgi:hypothetical protein